MTPPASSQATIITSLFIEAVRKGQPSWFRVSSKSMLPLIRLGDEVYIQPASAEDIGIGEIAAFETSDGLVIHRIVHSKQRAETIRLLQMSDVELLSSWLKEQAVVGKVISIRRSTGQGQILREMNLSHPIAQWWGTVTARIRYRLYLCNKNNPLRMVLRGCSRLCIHIGSWCIRSCCTSPVTQH